MSQTTEKSLSVVLVHGGFVDGSGWQGVHDILTKDGYEVIVTGKRTVHRHCRDAPTPVGRVQA